MHETLTPAYGRDYKSKKAVTEAFDAGQDFIHAASGRYANKQDMVSAGVAEVNLRYKNLRAVCVVKL